MKRFAIVGLAILLFLCLPDVRGWLESRMSLHMAMELPLLLIAGWLIASAATTPATRFEPFDDGGLFAATLASCVLAFWMLPAALDLAVLEPGTALMKYGTWALAGYMLRQAQPRLTPVVAAFFLGNAGWMTATAGLLYLDAEQQLCVNYLVDDQQTTGYALLAWGVALGGLSVAVLRPLLIQPRADTDEGVRP